MNTFTRSLPVAFLLTFLAATPGWSQAPASQCKNNLKQIGIGMHAQRASDGVLTAGRHRVELCASASGPKINVVDGTSNTVLVSEVPVSISGCPADLDDFGEATVRTSRRPDGGTQLTMVSRKHRGCTARALLLPAVQKVREAAPRQAAAVDYFLKIDGIDGESQDREHRGWIELTSVSWPAGREASSGIGDVVVMKELDKASPRLREACASGRQFSEARLSIRDRGSREASRTLAMRNVRLSGCGSGARASSSESLSLNFSEIKVEHRRQ